jgi:hypothetical protein
VGLSSLYENSFFSRHQADMATHTEETALPSERRFGLVFAAAIAAVGLWLLLRKHSPAGLGVVGAAEVLAVVAMLAPALLRLPNLLWFKLGHLMGLVVSPIVLGIMFLVLIAPVGIAMRLSGRDALRMRRKPGNSYWVPREPAGPAPDSFRNQY